MWDKKKKRPGLKAVVTILIIILTLVISSWWMIRMSTVKPPQFQEELIIVNSPLNFIPETGLLKNTKLVNFEEWNTIKVIENFTRQYSMGLSSDMSLTDLREVMINSLENVFSVYKEKRMINNKNNQNINFPPFSGYLPAGKSFSYWENCSSDYWAEVWLYADNVFDSNDSSFRDIQKCFLFDDNSRKSGMFSRVFSGANKGETVQFFLEVTLARLYFSDLKCLLHFYNSNQDRKEILKFFGEYEKVPEDFHCKKSDEQKITSLREQINELESKREFAIERRIKLKKVLSELKEAISTKELTPFGRNVFSSSDEAANHFTLFSTDRLKKPTSLSRPFFDVFSNIMDLIKIRALPGNENVWERLSAYSIVTNLEFNLINLQCNFFDQYISNITPLLLNNAFFKEESSNIKEINENNSQLNIEISEEEITNQEQESTSSNSQIPYN